MWIIAGLGNPGPEHEAQRHNIGFMALDGIVRRHWPMGNWRGRFKAETVEFSLGGEKILAMKPQTFMNRSGDAIGEAARFYKVPVERVIVLHDELDLDLARIEVKQGGSNGGHNGLRSMDAQIGPDYWRVRIGIGHPAKRFAPGTLPKPQKDALVLSHVLSNFSKDEITIVAPVLDKVADAAPFLAQGDFDGFRGALREPAAATTTR